MRCKKEEINHIMSDEDTVRALIPDLGEKMCLYLKLEPVMSTELMKNIIIEPKMSGHNSKVYLISFYNYKKILMSKICLKYSAKQNNILQIESVILNLLELNNIACSKIIESGVSTNGIPFILMEALDSKDASHNIIDARKYKSILDLIQKHESVLLANIHILQLCKGNLIINKNIDFENKLLSFLKEFTPNFRINSSLSFINYYLNNNDVIKKSIITDRSINNIFIDDNQQVVFIDFSTIRIGTQFDNFIQFIDDPRARFSSSKDELIMHFFLKNNLPESIIVFFHVASIYTNILQGIFTFQKNPKLSSQYIDNANNAFKRFTKKQSVLIEIIH